MGIMRVNYHPTDHFWVCESYKFIKYTATAWHESLWESERWWGLCFLSHSMSLSLHPHHPHSSSRLLLKMKMMNTESSSQSQKRLFIGCYVLSPNSLHFLMSPSYIVNVNNCHYATQYYNPYTNFTPQNVPTVSVRLFPCGQCIIEQPCVGG